MADKKQTREQRYNEILKAHYNTELSKCVVLGLKFKNESDQHHFHFAIMKNTNYYMYDGTGENAIIIMPAHNADKAGLIAIAERIGGYEYTPNLKL